MSAECLAIALSPIADPISESIAAGGREVEVHGGLADANALYAQCAALRDIPGVEPGDAYVTVFAGRRWRSEGTWEWWCVRLVRTDLDFDGGVKS